MESKFCGLFLVFCIFLLLKFVVPCVVVVLLVVPCCCSIDLLFLWHVVLSPIVPYVVVPSDCCSFLWCSFYLLFLAAIPLACCSFGLMFLRPVVPLDVIPFVAIPFACSFWCYSFYYCSFWLLFLLLLFLHPLIVPYSVVPSVCRWLCFYNSPLLPLNSCTLISEP